MAPLPRVRMPAKAKLVPLPAAGERLSAPLPKLAPFAAECAFWLAQYIDEKNTTARRRAAHDLATGLDAAFEWGNTIHFSVTRGLSPGPEPMRRWYVSSVTLLAYAGLRRATLDCGDLYDRTNMPLNPDDLGAYGDYHPNEPHASGLHVRREQLIDGFGIRWPQQGKVDWLEGDTFYAKVFTPATPTSAFAARYEEAYRRPFDAQAYASVVPILKAEVVF